MSEIIEVKEKKDTVLEIGSVTDRGPVRSCNEDSIAVVKAGDASATRTGTIMIVADGLGGHNAGEIASTMVTSELPRLYIESHGPSEMEDIVHAVHAVNAMVFAAAQESEELRGMGTTLVACAVLKQYVMCMNVGDSRAYIFRNGALLHRTKDHSLTEERFSRPGAGMQERLSHVLTQAIGIKPEIHPTVNVVRIEPGDCLVLCSDGLSDVVGDNEIGGILDEYPPGQAAQKLVDLAKEKGGEDNISVIVARVTDVADSKELILRVSDLDKYLVV